VNEASAAALVLPEDDIQQAVERTRAAVHEFMNGRTDAWVTVCSKRDDATLFGEWGGHERGWQQLEPRYRWASARYAGADASFENLAFFVGGDMACTVWIERSQAQQVGVAETAHVGLRISHIYRREHLTWKLIHRHADPLIATQRATAVIEREVV
jgi:hypothetical protein